MYGKLIIFSAPSGSGKTTIVKEILKSSQPFAFSVSATSRQAREQEQHGKDYYFLSPEDFKIKIESGEFLEWEEVYHNQFYGTLLSEVERLRNQGKHVIFDVDVVGGMSIKKYYKEQALSIFVKAPTLEMLKERLVRRGTESEAGLERRLGKALWEMEFAPQFDLVVVNEDLETAVNDCLNSISIFLKS
jgi:guanylate kinase